MKTATQSKAAGLVAQLLEATGLRSSIAKVGDTHRRLVDEVEDLKRQREEIAAAPTAKADLIAYADRWVDDEASKYRARLAELVILRARGEFGGEGFSAPNQPWLGRLLGLDTSPHNRLPDDGVSAGALCLIEGGAIKASLRREIEALDIPNEGLPQAKRKAELARLDREIEDLETQLEALRDEARRAGISLKAGGV